LIQLQNRIQEMKSTYLELHQKLIDLQQEKQIQMSRFSLESLLKRIRSLATKIDIESDNLQIEEDINEFIDTFLKLRIEYHLYMAKSNRINI
jgi:hypothetical protein